ncbi:MAG: MBL fold metallo-hydrolase [Myxococcaceae bacterium]|nr:MBL fold metallo-hydrolase [Myxococcaceae bacterium]
MEVRFWGVRGSVAVSGAHSARIGGNTSCLEVTSQGKRLILDAGTGLRALGDQMLREQNLEAALLWSHLHWDHVQGFPFFAPAYVPGARLTLYGPGPDGATALRDVLDRQMQPPSFPVPLGAMRSQMTFATARDGEPFEWGPFRITPVDLPHPQGCLGYRIEADGRSFFYATDVEMSLDELSPRIARAMEGVDALCLDAQYTPDEYAGKVGPSRRGWGHSTAIEAAKIGAAVNARRLFLFHHDPAHNDETVERMAEEARAYCEVAEPAREGKQILVTA